MFDNHPNCSLHSCLLIAIAFCVVALISSPAVAQPQPGKAQPDKIVLGQVYNGAVVEGSVRVFEKGDDPKGIPFEVNGPPFVKITKKDAGTQEFGTAGKFLVYDIFFSVATDRQGEFRGEIEVRIGKRKVNIPVSMTVLPDDPSTTRLLVVESPFHRFTTDDGSLFAAWTDIVKSSKIAPNYLEVFRDGPVLRDLDLTKFDVILIGSEGLFFTQDEDIRKLKAFLANGGRLVVAANYFARGTVDKANKLLADSGLEMADRESREYRLVVAEKGAGTPIAKHPLTEGVKTLRFFRPSPITLTGNATATLLVGAPNDLGDAIVAVGKSGEGEVVVLGVSLWWNWIASPQESNSDNSVLLRNILTKPRRER